MELVTIKTFDNPIDAHLLKTQLEDEGIKCFLFDENIVSLNMIYNLTVGGIKLKILKQDIEKAIGILAVNNNLALTDENGSPILCPKCGSIKIQSSLTVLKRGTGFLASFKTLLYALLGVTEKDMYICVECGASFKNIEQETFRRL